jgi:hypothetical protein
VIRSVIAATGSHIPSVRVPNDRFLQHRFLGPDQKPIDKPNEAILEQFEAITGIRERRYVPDNLVTSDIALQVSVPTVVHPGRRFEGESQQASSACSDPRALLSSRVAVSVKRSSVPA